MSSRGRTSVAGIRNSRDDFLCVVPGCNHVTRSDNLKRHYDSFVSHDGSGKPSMKYCPEGKKSHTEFFISKNYNLTTNLPPRLRARQEESQRSLLKMFQKKSNLEEEKDDAGTGSDKPDKTSYQAQTSQGQGQFDDLTPPPPVSLVNPSSNKRIVISPPTPLDDVEPPPLRSGITETFSQLEGGESKRPRLDTANNKVPEQSDKTSYHPEELKEVIARLSRIENHLLKNAEEKTEQSLEQLIENNWILDDIRHLYICKKCRHLKDADPPPALMSGIDEKFGTVNILGPNKKKNPNYLIKGVLQRHESSQLHVWMVEDAKWREKYKFNERNQVAAKRVVANAYETLKTGGTAKDFVRLNSLATLTSGDKLDVANKNTR